MKNNKWKASIVALLAVPALPGGCTCKPMCVARGTRIRTPNGRRRIEDFEVGDAISSVDPETGEIVEGTVERVQRAEREVLAMSVADNSIQCTNEHPLYDPEAGEYAPAGDWVTGERTSLMVEKGESFERVPVEDAVAYAGVAEVIDLSVDTEYSNFIAAGTVVHNKSYEETDTKNGAYADTADAEVDISKGDSSDGDASMTDTSADDTSMTDTSAKDTSNTDADTSAAPEVESGG